MSKAERALTREESKLLTRHRLLEACFELLLERGYDGLTTGRVATRAGIAQPSFYAHFKDMDELVDELAESRIDTLRKALKRTRSPLREGEPYDDATVETFRLGLTSIHRNADLLRLFMSEQYRSSSALGRCGRRLLQDLTQDLVDDMMNIPVISSVPKERLALIAESVIGLTSQMGLSLGKHPDEKIEELAQLLAKMTIAMLMGSLPTTTA